MREPVSLSGVIIVNEPNGLAGRRKLTSIISDRQGLLYSAALLNVLGTVGLAPGAAPA